MTERLMGVETEYAFVAFNREGQRADPHKTMTQIERLAEQHIPNLPGKGQRGIFLQNGSRFYRDFSNNDAHQEMTTPECPNPWDVVRYIVAVATGTYVFILDDAVHGVLGSALAPLAYA